MNSKRHSASWSQPGAIWWQREQRQIFVAFGILDLVDSDGADLAEHPVLQPEVTTYSTQSKTFFHEVRNTSAVLSRKGGVPSAPITRKITGGLLVEPRFGWLSIGQVLGEVGFRVEPEIGGLALVSGSAREVPPSVLAGPLVSRVTALVARNESHLCADHG